MYTGVNTFRRKELIDGIYGEYRVGRFTLLIYPRPRGPLAHSGGELLIPAILFVILALGVL